MKANKREIELLIKAQQTTEMLMSDLREVFTKTENKALEIIAESIIKDLALANNVLRRLI